MSLYPNKEAALLCGLAHAGKSWMNVHGLEPSGLSPVITKIEGKLTYHLVEIYKLNDHIALAVGDNQYTLWIIRSNTCRRI